MINYKNRQIDYKIRKKLQLIKYDNIKIRYKLLNQIHKNLKLFSRELKIIYCIISCDFCLSFIYV